MSFNQQYWSSPQNSQQARQNTIGHWSANVHQSSSSTPIPTTRPPALNLPHSNFNTIAGPASFHGLATPPDSGVWRESQSLLTPATPASVRADPLLSPYSCSTSSTNSFFDQSYINPSLLAGYEPQTPSSPCDNKLEIPFDILDLIDTDNDEPLEPAYDAPHAPSTEEDPPSSPLHQQINRPFVLADPIDLKHAQRAEQQVDRKPTLPVVKDAAHGAVPASSQPNRTHKKPLKASPIKRKRSTPKLNEFKPKPLPKPKTEPKVKIEEAVSEPPSPVVVPKVPPPTPARPLTPLRELSPSSSSLSYSSDSDSDYSSSVNMGTQTLRERAVAKAKAQVMAMAQGKDTPRGKAKPKGVIRAPISTTLRAGERRMFQNRDAQKRYRDKNRRLADYRGEFNTEAIVLVSKWKSGSLSAEAAMKRLAAYSEGFRRDVKDTCAMTSERLDEEIKSKTEPSR